GAEASEVTVEPASDTGEAAPGNGPPPKPPSEPASTPPSDPPAPPSNPEPPVFGARTGSSTTLVSVIISSFFVVTKHPVGAESWKVSWGKSDSNGLPKLKMPTGMTCVPGSASSEPLTEAPKVTV